MENSRKSPACQGANGKYFPLLLPFFARHARLPQVIIEGLKDRVQGAMARRGLGVTSLAHNLGVSYVTAWRLAHGWGVSVKTLMLAAEFFGEDIGEWIQLGRPEIRLSSTHGQPEAGTAEEAAPYGRPCRDDLFDRCLAALRQIEEGVAALKSELEKGKGGKS